MPAPLGRITRRKKRKGRQSGFWPAGIAAGRNRVMTNVQSCLRGSVQRYLVVVCFLLPAVRRSTHQERVCCFSTPPYPPPSPRPTPSPVSLVRVFACVILFYGSGSLDSPSIHGDRAYPPNTNLWTPPDRRTHSVFCFCLLKPCLLLHFSGLYT